MTTVTVRPHTRTTHGHTVDVSGYTYERNAPPGGWKARRPSARDIPEYRQDTFVSEEKKAEIDAFNAAVDQLPEAGDIESFVYGELYVAEGGEGQDRDSTASSGITKRALMDAQHTIRHEGAASGFSEKDRKGIAKARKSADLTPGQKAIVYRKIVDHDLREVGGHGALDEIGDGHVAAAVANTIFTEGQSRGVKAVQRAINKDRRERNAGDMTEDAHFGPATLVELQTLAGSPERKRKFLDRLALERYGLRKGLPNELGMRRTIDHFSYSRSGQ